MSSSVLAPPWTESRLTQPRNSRLDQVCLYGVVALVLFGPLAFGAVESWSISIMEVCGRCAFHAVGYAASCVRGIGNSKQPFVCAYVAFWGSDSLAARNPAHCLSRRHVFCSPALLRLWTLCPSWQFSACGAHHSSRIWPGFFPYTVLPSPHLRCYRALPVTANSTGSESLNPTAGSTAHT